MTQRGWRRVVATPWLWVAVTLVYITLDQPVNWFWNVVGVLFWVWVAVWVAVGSTRVVKTPPRRRKLEPEDGVANDDLSALSRGTNGE